MRRPESRYEVFRKRVPGDVFERAAGQKVIFTFPEDGEDDPAFTVQVSIAKEIKISLRTLKPSTVQKRHGLALAQFVTICESIRKGPQPLTHKQTVALSGVLYRAFSYSLEDDPGDPEIWEQVQAANTQALTGKDNLTILVPGEPVLNPLGLFPDAKAAHKASMEQRFGPLVDLILAKEGILTTPESRDALIVEAGKALTEVAGKLTRNADGDYRPDTNVERFPLWEKPQDKSKKSSKGKISFQDIFDRWKTENNPAPATVTTFRSYWRQLKEFVGHDDPTRVTKDNMIFWKDALIAGGQTPKAVREGKFAICKVLFNYALANDLVTLNPFTGIVIRSKAKAGMKRLTYTDDEVAKLLMLADTKKESNSAFYWLPWLAALSGARIAEVGQLWGQRVVQIEGIWSIKIAPAEDGGSLKNAGSERDVPLHPALIERGFLDFVRSTGDGPLFYGAAKGAKRGRRGRADNDVDGRRHASKGVTNRLAQWIRENGFDDPRKAPNHSLRHWFKTALQKAGVLDSVADAIQGHAGSRGESDGYRHAGIQVKYEAICKVKVPG